MQPGGSGSRAEKFVEEGRGLGRGANFQVCRRPVQVQTEVQERATFLLGHGQGGCRSGAVGRESQSQAVWDWCTGCEIGRAHV